MLEKYEIKIQRSTVQWLVSNYKKTSEKQDISEQKKPEQPQYPFLSIKPTKTLKKDTFDSQNGGRLFVQKDLLTENKKKEQNTLPTDGSQNEKTAGKKNPTKDITSAFDESQQDTAGKTKLENFDSETTVKYEDGELEQNSVPKNEPDYFGFESAIEGMTDESGQNSAEENELDTFYSENTVKYRDGESGQNSVQKNKSDKKAKKTSNKWWQYKKYLVSLMKICLIVPKFSSW
jgi:hypothetical protein